MPNDQGGRVYLDFNRCVYDQVDELNQLYTVFRLDMIANEPVWVVAGSGAAIGDQSYTYEILTLQDSPAAQDNVPQDNVLSNGSFEGWHPDPNGGWQNFPNDFNRMGSDGVPYGSMLVDPDGAAIYGSPDGSLLEVYDCLLYTSDAADE